MSQTFSKIFLPLFFFSLFCFGENGRNANQLLYDLEIALWLDRKLCARFPVSYNHILSSGYFTTPSARMSDEGDLSFGFSQAPPYQNLNARFQVFQVVELSANYRIFKGVEDPNLSPHGFGDFADRGANIKWALITPEETLYDMPGLAIGIEDFMGSKRFTNYFAVLSKVWPSYGLETSLGWGSGRYTHGPSRGFFAGASYFPLWERDNCFFQNAGFAIEYDPIDYSNPRREPHPDGRISHTPINFGCKYKYGKILDLSASYIRGQAFAFSGSIQYNFGHIEGFLPKTKDPEIYRSPCNYEPLGCFRPQEVMIQNLAFVLKHQGFRLINAKIHEDMLWISVSNQCYRKEAIVRKRLQHILASLTPENICTVVLILESYGLPCQQYIYPRDLLLRYACNQIGEGELTLLTPRNNFTKIPIDVELLFDRRHDLWKYQISPRIETFFGSAKGKIKYDFGVKSNLEGFLLNEIFYETQFSYTLLSTTNDVADVDFFSPSQLPNVLTDYINYRKKRNFSTDRVYVQKNWNLGQGFFSKLGFGYFQVNYAGIEGELLWYQCHSNFAIGCEGALLKKRRYTGLGFQSKLRKMKGFTTTYVPYTVLSQYFLNLYFDIPDFSIAGKIGMGGFLAHDKGFRFEVTRYFDSGLRVTGWMTVTNANDMIHNENFYNRGICIELPLDLMYRCSSRRMWNYGMAAWLRDAGATISTGKSLFEIINLERRH